MPNNDARMTFTEHLAELRIRIIRAMISFLIGLICCYGFSDTIFWLVARPLLPHGYAVAIKGKTDSGAVGENRSSSGEQRTPSAGNSGGAGAGPEWITLDPIEGFVVKLRLALYAGLLVASPYILYQAGAFVFPGLKPKERKAFWIVVLGCGLLGIAGVLVAYFGVFPLVLPYLLQWAPEGVRPQLQMKATLSLMVKGYLGFALAFQFPMVVLTMVYLDLLRPETLRKYRRMAIIVMTVLAAIFTPPDPFSMLMLAAPLVLLYEISIWCSYAVARRNKNQTEADS